MLGYGDIWVQGLAGISQSNTSVGWKEIILKPVVVGDLTSATNSFRSAQGIVSASWVKNGGTLNYDVSIPVGSTALFYVNGTTVTEGGYYLTIGQRGVLSIENLSSSSAVVGLASGDYSFIIS